MGLVPLFKAGMIGSFALMITVGIVVSVIVATEKQMSQASHHVRVYPIFLTFFIVLIGGLFGMYWLITTVAASNIQNNDTVAIIYGSVFALVPSVALIMGVTAYYLEVRLALRKQEAAEAVKE